MGFIHQVKTNKRNKRKDCSYRQAQKAINVFLKLFVDWANLPDRKTAKRMRPFLHVPLDSVVMKTVIREYAEFYQQTIRPLQSGFNLSRLSRKAYNKWQELFRQKYPPKPLLFDVAWWSYRRKRGKKP